MNEFYESLSPAIRDELSRHEEQATVPAGRKLISEDVIPEHLIAIEHGSVEISVPAGNKATTLSVAGEGKVLGLRPIVSGVLPEIVATTLEECRLLLISREDFLDVLGRHPEMYFAIAKVLSTDFNAAQRFLRETARSVKKDKLPNAVSC